MREYSRKYRAANRERLTAQTKAWKAENKDRVAASDEKYREAHAAEIRERGAKYRQTQTAKVRASQKANHQRHPEKRQAFRQKYQQNGRSRIWRLQHRYGLTPEDVAALLDVQGNVCAVCGKPFGTRKQYIDHDHGTGAVRGVVHMECNTLMGLAKDDPVLLEKAAAYLRRAALKYQRGDQ